MTSESINEAECTRRVKLRSMMIKKILKARKLWESRKRRSF